MKWISSFNSFAFGFNCFSQRTQRFSLSCAENEKEKQNEVDSSFSSFAFGLFNCFSQRTLNISQSVAEIQNQKENEIGFSRHSSFCIKLTKSPRDSNFQFLIFNF